MVSAHIACSFFLKIKLDWEVASVDAMGLSGGLLVAWDPSNSKLKAFVVQVGILMTGFFKDFTEELNLINVYGPYNCKELFWDRIQWRGPLTSIIL